jgi:hypothetical protein
MQLVIDLWAVLYFSEKVEFHSLSHNPCAWERGRTAFFIIIV